MKMHVFTKKICRILSLIHILPLHRQLDIFEREGIHLSPSTVSNWMMAAAQRLEPIYNEPVSYTHLAQSV